MLKKIILIFLFSAFSVQAVQLPKFSDLNDLTKEVYEQNVTILSQIPRMIKFLPKKPIDNKLTQIYFITLINAIIGRSMLGTIAVVFYNNIQKIELIKTSFEKAKIGYLIALDINKIGQDIKDVFDITKPTIIYYYNGEESARSINFDIGGVLQQISNNPFEQNIEIPRFADLKSLMHETFYQYMSIFSKNPNISKLICKTPITHELIQVRFLILLGAIIERSRLGITAVIFYNNAQQIESFKKLVEKQKSVYFIVTDIHKTEQEIKNIFNITEPTIIYYNRGEEIARSINFDIKDVENYITNRLQT